MKKTLIVATCAIFLASCGAKTAESVKVEDIKDACGCADAFVVVANDILNTVGDKSEDDVEGDEELMKTVETKMDKLQELEKKCRKELEVSMDDMKECNSELETVAKKFEEKF